MMPFRKIWSLRTDYIVGFASPRASNPFFPRQKRPKNKKVRDAFCRGLHPTIFPSDDFSLIATAGCPLLYNPVKRCPVGPSFCHAFLSRSIGQVVYKNCGGLKIQESTQLNELSRLAMVSEHGDIARYPNQKPPLFWERDRLSCSGVTLGVPGSTPGRGIFRVEGWVLPIVRSLRLHDAPFRRLTCFMSQRA